MTAGIRNIKIRFDGDATGLNRAARDGEQSISRWEKGMKRLRTAAVAAGAVVGVALVAVAKDAFTLGNRIEELDTKSKTVFGDQLKDVQAWAKANANAFGTSSRNVVALAANTADLLKPMGFATDQAAKMAKEITGLAPALAKWEGKGRSAAEVSEILTKALLGERDELKSLGISISEADVSARLLAKGQQDLTGTALEQAEALATQELIMEKSTDAQAAWAAGGKVAAERQGKLKATIEELREKIAKALLPVFQAITTWINEKAIPAFDAFIGWVKENKDWLGRLALAVGAAIVAFKIFNLVLSVNPFVLIATALAALVVLIITSWDEITAITSTVWTAITGFLGTVWEEIKTIALVAWEIIKTFIIDPIQAVWDFLVNAWTSITTFLSDAWNGIASVVSTVWHGIKEVFRTVMNFIIGALNAGIDAINLFIEAYNFLAGSVGDVTGLDLRIGTIPNIPNIGPSKDRKSVV